MAQEPSKGKSGCTGNRRFASFHPHSRSSASEPASTTFYISCLLGGLPLAAHLLIASAVALEVLPLRNAIAFENQNWLGHLVLVSLAVGSGTLMNVAKIERKWSTRLKINFFHLLASTILLWLLFGIMAVAGTPTTWAAWLATALVVAAGTIFAYNVDMSIAVLSVTGGGEDGA